MSEGILATVAVGVFLLLCVVSWHLVLMLKQARQTALAVEQFLVTVRPKVETAADQIGTLAGRANTFLESAEEGRGGLSGVLGIVGQALGGWTAGSQLVAMIAAL